MRPGIGQEISETEIHPDEWEFLWYKQGRVGSFRKALYNLYWKGDSQNQAKLEGAFPELWVLRRYSTERGYWENLQSRWRSQVEEINNA